jgi:hypothetical protein
MALNGVRSNIMAHLTIQIPQGQERFEISAAPAMPTVLAEAVVSGSTQNLLTTLFRWTARVLFDGRGAPYSRPEPPFNVIKKMTGPNLQILPRDWPRFGGGNLTLRVDAVIDSQPMVAELGGLTITGANPSPSDVRLALGQDTLRRIANQESGFQQFLGDWPKFSSDGANGAGIMQITPATIEQRWNWRANVAAGIAVFNDRYALTNTYVASMSKSTALAGLIAQYNARRVADKKSALTVTVPPFTEEQRLRDATRGYNGWAGQDPIDPSLHLHEYRLRKSGALPLVQESTDRKTGVLIWETVPTSDRPASGDPDYVEHVWAKSP